MIDDVEVPPPAVRLSMGAYESTPGGRRSEQCRRCNPNFRLKPSQVPESHRWKLQFQPRALASHHPSRNPTGGRDCAKTVPGLRPGEGVKEKRDRVVGGPIRAQRA